jgi:DNA-binding PadR family transcriptional regulator
MAERAMQEATFLILTALATGSQHGYGIITEVSQISGGRVRLRAGTLYTALDRLRIDEMIAVDREEIVDNRLRRYYRLTPKGSQKLAAEAARLQANAAAALSRLDLAGAPRDRVLWAGAGVPAAAGLVPARVPPRSCR